MSGQQAEAGNIALFVRILRVFPLKSEACNTGLKTLTLLSVVRFTTTCSYCVTSNFTKREEGIKFINDELSGTNKQGIKCTARTSRLFF